MLYFYFVLFIKVLVYSPIRNSMFKHTGSVDEHYTNEEIVDI